MMVSLARPRRKYVSANQDETEPVTSAVVHMSGTVVATCSGQRRPSVSESDLDETGESSDSDVSSSATSSTTSASSSKPLLDNRFMIWSI